MKLLYLLAYLHFRSCLPEDLTVIENVLEPLSNFWKMRRDFALFMECSLGLGSLVLTVLLQWGFIDLY